jgi:hypothetical protein
MDLCFSEYYLLWSGGLLPYEPSGNKTSRENKYFVYFWIFPKKLLFDASSQAMQS